MPPEFENRLKELGIPFTQREGDITVVEGHELAIKGSELRNAHELSQLLLFIARTTDAELDTHDGDQYIFRPKK